MEDSFLHNSSTRAKHSKQIYSTQRKMAALTNEYRCKVRHNFSHYVFFGKSSKRNESLEDAVHMITSYRGYEAHRMINHKGQTSHFYIRFLSPEFALEAVARIKQTKTDYVADTVDRMLLGWYLLEMSSGAFPWTLAILDVVGNVDHSDLLSENSLKRKLFEFGDPKIHSYPNANHKVDHMQVLFSSMAEALGASIALGCWYRKMDKENPDYYFRLKILSSEKEISLLKKCVDQPLNQTGDDLEALDLDYFLPKVSDTSNDVSFRNTEMQYQDVNAFFMTQPGVSEGTVPRPRPYRRQYSRGRGNTRNRMKASEVPRNGRQHNSNSFQTVTESEYLPGAGLVSNEFLRAVQPVP